MSTLTLYLPERAANRHILASGDSLDTLRAVRMGDASDSRENKTDWMEHHCLCKYSQPGRVTVAGWAEVWTACVNECTSVQREDPAKCLVY